MVEAAAELTPPHAHRYQRQCYGPHPLHRGRKSVLTAELTDNAGWELLIQLADEVGEAELSGLSGRPRPGAGTLATIRGWLTNLVTSVIGTPAV
jgi:hypothetical protein